MKTINYNLLVIILPLLISACQSNVQRVEITPDTASGNRGDEIHLSATVIGPDDPLQEVIWEVYGGVEGTSISIDGILKIGTAESADTLSVTATPIINTKKSGRITVYVLNRIAIGPGGGIIFYDKGEYSDGWRFLEAAPSSREFTAQWGLRGIDCPDTLEEIGTGKANTAYILKLLEANGETKRAAQLCASLNINGLNDWFLPSIDELDEMYKALRLDENIGKFNLSGTWTIGYYWSSTTWKVSNWDDTNSYGASTRYGTWYQRFRDGGQGATTATSVVDTRSYEMSVRAIRAF